MLETSPIGAGVHEQEESTLPDGIGRDENAIKHVSRRLSKIRYAVPCNSDGHRLLSDVDEFTRVTSQRKIELRGKHFTEKGKVRIGPSVPASMEVYF